MSEHISKPSVTATFGDGDTHYKNLCSQVENSTWKIDRQKLSGVDCALLLSSVARPSKMGENEAIYGQENFFLPMISEDKPCLTRQNGLTPKPPMGGQTGVGVSPQPQRASSGASEGALGLDSLPTIKAAGTGRQMVVIGFDTEFQEVDSSGDVVARVLTAADEDEVLEREAAGETSGRRILSYQFSWIVGERITRLVIVPLGESGGMLGHRPLLVDCLALVVRVGELWRDTAMVGYRGYAQGSFWRGDFKESIDALYKRGAVQLCLAGHFLRADMTAFGRPHGNSKHDDILRRLTSAAGGLVSLQPIRMFKKYGSSARYWLPMSVMIADTMTQAAPGAKSLKSLGEVCGVPKIDIGDDIERMSALRKYDLLRFLEYSANDADIVVEYLSTLWGDKTLPPVTLSSGGARALRAAIMEYWGISGNAAFSEKFQGLFVADQGTEISESGESFYQVRGLEPINGMVRETHSAFKAAFHGGWNSSLKIGYFNTRTFDHDIMSAYPSAMAAVLDPEYISGEVDELLRDCELSEAHFTHGFVTPLVACVSFEFPEGVQPCIPVSVGNSVIYPRTSLGVKVAREGKKEDFDGVQAPSDGVYAAEDHVWASAPELLLALRKGAKIHVLTGRRLKVLEHGGKPSMSLRYAVRQMVADRVRAKILWGKGSPADLMIKVITNSCYGKLAQDVSERTGWDAWDGEMKNVGGSAVTSPYHACMITSLVRALLLAMADEVPFYSVTTDGFITDVADIEEFECYGLSDVFRDAREALSGSPQVWEIKHRQDTLLNLTTRGNVSLDDTGVLAKAGLKAPVEVYTGDSELDERSWFFQTAISRVEPVDNPYLKFPSFRQLSRANNRMDFFGLTLERKVSLDFDMKRAPVMETLHGDDVAGYEVAGFATVAWDNVMQYVKAKDIARHIAQFRPGTIGDNRPGGTLREADSMRVWSQRFNQKNRRIRTYGGEVLKGIVAGYKAGILTVDDVPVLYDKSVKVSGKIDWLSSLGFGEFSYSLWRKMGDKSRCEVVIRDTDFGEIRQLLESVK